MPVTNEQEIQKRAEKSSEDLKIWQRPKDGGSEVFWDWYLHTDCYQIPRPKRG